MLSKMIVATDGSEASDRMIGCLAGLHAIGTRAAVLTHVFNVEVVGGLYQSLRTALMPRLEEQRTRLAANGFDATLETPLGIPCCEINRLAEQSGASLVVVGSLGESLIGEMLLGSTAHRVLEAAVKPVLLIRLAITTDTESGAKRCEAVCRNLFDHILFPTDFSDTADRAFLVLEELAREVKPRVSLVHVQDRTRLHPHLSDRLEEFNRIDQDRLDRMSERLKAMGATDVSTAIDCGVPTERILARARAAGPTLILMGSQGRGVFEEMLLGSVANHLARLAPLPILFVPRVH